MIHCSKCGTENQPQQDTCHHCKADLLPAEGIGTRLMRLIVGLILLVFIPGIASYFIFQMQAPPVLYRGAGYLLIVIAVVFFISTIYTSVRKTPLSERYAIRARRHIELDAQQALGDFTKALELVPQNERTPLLKERAAIYEKLEMHQELGVDLEELQIQKEKTTGIRYELIGGFIIPRHLCVSCGKVGICTAHITKSVGSTKQTLSLTFPVCSECDAARQHDRKVSAMVKSAVKMTGFEESHAWTDGAVTFHFENVSYAMEFRSANIMKIIKV